MTHSTTNNKTSKDIFWEIVEQGYFYCSEGLRQLYPQIKVILDERTGMYSVDPDSVQDLSLQDYDRLLEICLSYKVDYDQLGEFVFGSPANTDLGLVKQTYLAQSTNYQRNYAATSGAIIKETLRYLFESTQIEAAIVIQKTGRLEYKPIKITSASQIEDLPPSVYHMIDYTDTIKLLEEASESKIAVVGVPWQIDGMYLYIQKINPKLKEKIAMTIGLLTGWYFTYHTIKALCSYYNLDYNKLDDIRYRGGGKSGKTRFIFQDGTEKVVDRFTLKSIVAFERYFNLPRYLLEINTHNMLADLVVGDAHLPECSYSKTGISLIIARNEKANNTLAKMQDAEYIKLLSQDNEVLIRSQKRGRLYGDFAYSYNQYLQSNQTKWTPVLTGPNKSSHLPQKDAQSFHKQFLRRRSLQSKGKYGVLLRIKYSEDFLPIFTKLSLQVIDKILFKIGLKKPPIQEQYQAQIKSIFH